MEAVKVSIIVPIYNTKDYLEKCLYSVRVQSYRNIEVIMVDDGSTDGSADVCQQICMKDSRFHYYYQKNQGVSSARNYGIELAKGDLIAFVDSDDWIEADMYEKMVDLMLNNESDMVMCDAIIWEDGKRGKVDSIECTQEVKNVLVQTRHKYLKTRLMKKRMYLMLTLISVIKRYKFYRKV